MFFQKLVGRTSVHHVPRVDFTKAMGQHFSSVCVITTSINGKNYGLTATAVSSVCVEPPRLLICINKSGLTHRMIKKAKHFCVNVLGEEQDDVAKVFAGMSGDDSDRFSVGEWTDLATGSPALVGASSVFDCRIAESLNQFSHTVFIGDVVGVSSQSEQDTLLYGGQGFRTLNKA